MSSTYNKKLNHIITFALSNEAYALLLEQHQRQAPSGSVHQTARKLLLDALGVGAPDEPARPRPRRRTTAPSQPKVLTTPTTPAAPRKRRSPAKAPAPEPSVLSASQLLDLALAPPQSSPEGVQKTLDAILGPGTVQAAATTPGGAAPAELPTAGLGPRPKGMPTSPHLNRKT